MDKRVRRARREKSVVPGIGLDPELWGTLPTDLLQLVFSLLPVVDICKLRLLSKTWKQNVDSSDSPFSKLLEQTTYPSMFGSISLRGEGRFRGLVVDLKRAPDCATCAFDVLPSENYVSTMGATDGGLVCFVSRGSMLPRFVVVMNPLTGRKVELPGFCSMEGCKVSNLMPLMVQLTMDRRTWQYKVLVVGFMEGGAPGRGVFAQSYDSQFKQWTVVGPELHAWERVYGYAFQASIDESRRLNYLAPLGPCMYDFAAGGLHYFRKSSGGLEGPYAPYLAPHGKPAALPFVPDDNIAHAVLKNHLFVLRRYSEATTVPQFCSFYISEYVLEAGAAAWEEVGRIEILALDDLSNFMCGQYNGFFLDACQGFLLLLLDHRRGFAYDLARGYWVGLPPLRPSPTYRRDFGPTDMMCELRWNAMP